MVPILKKKHTQIYKKVDKRKDVKEIDTSSSFCCFPFLKGGNVEDIV